MKSRLSPRQLKVVEYLSWDWSTKDVAKKLGSKPDTIKTHVGDALRRTHTHTRAGLIGLCLREGWIE